MAMGLGLNTFILIIQLLICGYAGGYLTLLYVKRYNKAITDEQKRKKKYKKNNPNEED